MLKSLEERVTEEFYNNNKHLCLPILGNTCDQILLSDYSETRFKIVAGGDNQTTKVDYSVVRFDERSCRLSYTIQNQFVVKYVENAWNKFPHGLQWQWQSGLTTLGDMACKPEVWPLMKIMLENLNPDEKVIWGMSGSKSWYNESGVWKPIYGRGTVKILAKENSIKEINISEVDDLEKPREQDYQRAKLVMEQYPEVKHIPLDDLAYTFRTGRMLKRYYESYLPIFWLDKTKIPYKKGKFFMTEGRIFKGEIETNQGTLKIDNYGSSDDYFPIILKYMINHETSKTISKSNGLPDFDDIEFAVKQYLKEYSDEKITQAKQMLL